MNRSQLRQIERNVGDLGRSLARTRADIERQIGNDVTLPCIVATAITFGGRHFLEGAEVNLPVDVYERLRAADCVKLAAEVEIERELAAELEQLQAQHAAKLEAAREKARAAARAAVEKARAAAEAKAREELAS